MVNSALWLIPLLLVPAAVFAQSPASSTPEPTRAEEIEKQRAEKETKVTPEERERGEQILLNIRRNRFLRSIVTGYNGFSASIGNAVPGAGLAVGARYVSPELFGNSTIFRVRAVASTRQYFRGDASVLFPYLLNERLFVETNVGYHNFAQMPYYGPGPDSVVTGRSNFRFEGVEAGGRAGVRIIRGLTAGVHSSWADYNVGPGGADQFISTDRQFPPSVTPGIDRQTSFWKNGVFAEYDWRRGGSEPTAGGYYSAKFTDLADRDLKRFSHQRYDFEVQHYQPFFNKKRVIALRAETSLAGAKSGNEVPFYLQPTLGGANTLRGFRWFRFYDDNSLLFNGEYRWEAGRALDMAIFTDAGKVFASRKQLNFSNLEYSYGIGLRAKFREDLVARIDFGFSNEGFQIWFRFNNVF